MSQRTAQQEPLPHNSALFDLGEDDDGINSSNAGQERVRVRAEEVTHQAERIAAAEHPLGREGGDKGRSSSISSDQEPADDEAAAAAKMAFPNPPSTEEERRPVTAPSHRPSSYGGSGTSLEEGGSTPYREHLSARWGRHAGERRHFSASPSAATVASTWSSSQHPGGRRPPPFLSRNSRAMRLASEASLGTGLEGRPGSVYGDETVVGPSWSASAKGSTPLDRTIDAIGMGSYQYAVLILTGFGWAADNMWLQGVAITLPRIQDEWGIRDQWIGLVSSSTFAGMMFGALAWGSYADAHGRKSAFNLTLLITSVFGMLSAFAPTFPLLCLCLFLLGTGVGGSMPTDGTIFLEALPKRYHYLVTALSVFFAAGSVITSVLGLYLIPQNSCGMAMACRSEDNKGWRYLLASLGSMVRFPVSRRANIVLRSADKKFPCLLPRQTMLFVLARLVFFTLFESPKFLVSAGKHEEARDVLQRIATFNGDPRKVRLSDVRDDDSPQTRLHRGDVERGSQTRPMSTVDLQPSPHISEDEDEADSVSEEERNGEERQRLICQSASDDARRHGSMGAERARSSHNHSERDRSGSTAQAPWPRTLRWIPASWRPGLQQGMSRYNELFTPYWRRTTTLIWLIWTVFTLAYTMVNVFLPKYLESRTGGGGSSPHHDDGGSTDPNARRSAIAGVMREFVFYSLASLPGSLLGAWLIETPLGRIKSMALSTALLALSLLAFALLSSTVLLVVMSSCAISLFASVAYAVIYSYSPEVFATSLRGTACGTASALSRMAGILAPVLAGALMQLGGINLPLYIGFALFGVTVWLQLALPYETRGQGRSEEDERDAGEENDARS